MQKEIGMPKKCFFCEHWDSDPEALDRVYKAIAQLNMGLSVTAIPPMYGKCVATYFDEKMDPVAENFGTASTADCIVKDGKGKLMFSEVPLG